MTSEADLNRPPLRVLVLDDNAADAAIVEMELARAGFGVYSKRVGVGADFSAALRREAWDLIIADDELAAFSASQALEWLGGTDLDIPFIVVSGSVDEQHAVALMRAGAHDFVNKANLARLVPAVGRELREADARRARRRAEAALRRREKELESVTRNIPDVIARFDRELRFTFVNHAAEGTIGLSPDGFLGRTNRELGVAPIAYDDWEETLRRVFATGEPEALEFEYDGPQGPHWFITRVVPETESGEVHTVLSVTRDITARKEAEERLRTQAEQQAVLAELGKRALSATSPHTLIQEASELIRRTLGADVLKIVSADALDERLRVFAGAGWPEGVVGTASVPANRDSVAGYTLAEERSVVIRDLTKDPRFGNPELLRGRGIRSGMTVLMRGRAGALGTLGVYTRVVREFSASELHFFESVADIFARALERARTESALRASEERFRAIIEAAAEGIVIVDAAGAITFANRRAEAIFGLSRSVVAGRAYDDPHWKITDFDGAPFPEDELPFVRVMRSERPVFGVEHAIEDASGRRILLSISGAPLRDPSGKIEGMVASVHDVTARRQDENRIRFQARVLDAVGESVIATDSARIVTYWNRASEVLFGWSNEEALGRGVRELIEISASESRDQIEAKVAAGATWSGTVEARCRDGAMRTIYVTVSPIFNDRGAFVGFIAISSDLAERRRLEAELRQAQKMEAVGRLAGGVAHDFNNILTAIGGCSDFLLSDLGEDDPLREDAAAIRSAVDRASGLTRQLLAFSQKQIANPRVVDVGVIVRDMAGMLRRVIPESVEVSVTAAPGATVLADPVEVGQVVMNLVVNAIDAMPAGGRLQIDVSSYEGELPRAPSGRYVVLAVIDSGTGIDEQVLPLIFEPFFTTKQQGKGTGLGLSTVYGIVNQARGDIDVRSTPGMGTAFRIYLPLAEMPESLPAAASAPTPHGGGGTIILVEDDLSVRAIARRVLTREGYRVIEASEPTTALRLLAGSAAPHIVLLVTDLVMPGMSGPELAQRVAAVVPGVPILFMSGYAPEEVMREGIVIPDARFLSKPFSRDDLLAQVRETIEASPRRQRGGGARGTSGDQDPIQRTTVLVVDDDVDVRRVIRRSLEPHGCAILEAANGFEARQILSRATPNVVVMDLVLPGMEGREVANTVLSRWPGLPVLFISGYTSHESMRLGELPPGQLFLRKPFSSEDLVGALRRIVTRR